MSDVWKVLVRQLRINETHILSLSGSKGKMSLRFCFFCLKKNQTSYINSLQMVH